MHTLSRPFDITTHNGIVTVLSLQTGEHRTFRIKTQKPDAKFAPGERIAQLLTGPDNTSDYRSFGFVSDGNVHLFRKQADQKFFQWAKRFLENPGLFASTTEVNFEGRCRVCDRALTDPLSCSLGIGPTCRGE